MEQRSFANCCGCKMTIVPQGAESQVVRSDRVVAYVHGYRADCCDRAARMFPGCTFHGGRQSIQPWVPTGRVRNATGKDYLQIPSHTE